MPTYVPHAWLNPKTDSWEPADGYEVDMSGFEDDSDDSSSIPTSTSLRRKAPPPLSLGAAAAAPAAGERSHGAGGSTRSNGSWSGSLDSPPLARRISGSSVGTASGTPSSRETQKRLRENAFRLSPETKWRFARNEEDHNRAMALLLGQQVYTCTKHKGAARLQRLPGVFDPGEEVKPTFLLPEPIPPRPRTRSLGAGLLTTWARSGSKSSVDSGTDSPSLRRGSKDGKDGASGGRIGHGSDISFRGTPSRTRGLKAATRTFSGTSPTTPGSGGDEGVNDVSVSGASGAGSIHSRPRRPSVSSAKEGKPKRSSPSLRHALLSSDFASVKVASSTKSPSSSSRGSGGVIHSNHNNYSRRASTASAPNRLSAWPELPQPWRPEGRNNLAFQRGVNDLKSSGSISRSASGNISVERSGSVSTSGSGSINSGAGKSRNVFSTAARKASSPVRSSHMLRSPPRRGSTEASVRGESRLRRHATIFTTPLSPKAARSRRTTRTLSFGGLSSRVSSRGSRSRLSLDSLAGGAEGVAEDMVSVLAEGRERVEIRLARFDEIMAFAANPIKERFFLPGARNFSEGAARRTHRRRRSGGESSAGRGSSTGFAAAIVHLTVRL